MAKEDSAKRSTRRSKAATSEDVEEDNVKSEGQTESVPSSEQAVRIVEDAPKEDQAEPDSQMDAVIEVKGNASTVAVSWDEKNGEGEVDDTEKKTTASDQMMDSGEQTPIISSADAVDSTEDVPTESAATKMEEELQESGECQKDIVAGSTATVTLTWEKKNEEGENEEVEKETNGGELMIIEKKPVQGKRKSCSAVETSVSKKTKLINDGFCLYVGNLNNSKTFDEVKDSLANYFMTNSLLVQDIRLDRSRKHAHVDLASEMDLTKGLTFNGKILHDKPMKIAKAKVKSADKVKAPVKDEKDKDGRCLFLKNLPYNATKKDILKIFCTAVRVRFPGGTEGPMKGIAFVEFKNKSIAKKVLERKQGVKFQDRTLIVDAGGKTQVPEVAKAKNNKDCKDDKDKKDETKAAPPNTTLFVSNLPYNVQEKHLKKFFEKSVGINVPKLEGQSRGFAFVEFAAVADAEKALQSSKDMKIFKRAIKVEFRKAQEKSEQAKVLLKTLIVMGLAEKTTAETLKSAFEGAFSARVTVDKETGVSKKFGFVEFESEDGCKAVKEAMEDCEIDGNKVTVAYAKAKGVTKPPSAPGKPPAAPGKAPAAPGKPPAAPGKPPAAPGKAPAAPGKAPAAQGAGKGRKRNRGGKGRGDGKPQDAVKEVENKDGCSSTT